MRFKKYFAFIEGPAYAPPLRGRIVQVLGPDPHGRELLTRPLNVHTAEGEDEHTRFVVFPSALRPVKGR